MGGKEWGKEGEKGSALGCPSPSQGGRSLTSVCIDSGVPMHSRTVVDLVCTLFPCNPYSRQDLPWLLFWRSASTVRAPEGHVGHVTPELGGGHTLPTCILSSVPHAYLPDISRLRGYSLPLPLPRPQQRGCASVACCVICDFCTSSVRQHLNLLCLDHRGVFKFSLC